jgi:hypothetical protein
MRLTVLALALAIAPLASADTFNITADNVAGALAPLLRLAERLPLQALVPFTS